MTKVKKLFWTIIFVLAAVITYLPTVLVFMFPYSIPTTWEAPFFEHAAIIIFSWLGGMLLMMTSWNKRKEAIG